MLLHEDENDFMNSQVLSRCSLSAGGPISVKQFLEVLLTKLVFRHLKIFLAGPRELWGGTEWPRSVQAGEDGRRRGRDRPRDVHRLRQEVRGLQGLHGGREEEWRGQGRDCFQGDIFAWRSTCESQLIYGIFHFIILDFIHLDNIGDRQRQFRLYNHGGAGEAGHKDESSNWSQLS